MGLGKDGDFLPGVFGPCQMPPSEQRGCPALLPWMNANEGVCVCLNVIHTTSNWACKEVQNWGWQPPKPKQPGRMSDITCAWDTVHAWIIIGARNIQAILTVTQLWGKGGGVSLKNCLLKCLAHLFLRKIINREKQERGNNIQSGGFYTNDETCCDFLDSRQKKIGLAFFFFFFSTFLFT